MVDQPPDSQPSATLNKEDWFQKFPQEGIPRSDKASADNQPRKDEPPDPKDGGPKQADVMEEQEVEDRKQTRSQRERYAEKAYGLAFWCLYGWAAMLFASGFVNGVRGLPLWSDKVIIAATTGVTVSVLAAFLGVIRGLFGVNGSNGNGTGNDKKPSS